MKVIAHVTKSDGDTAMYQFHQKNILYVYRSCQKFMGKPMSTTMENGKPCWNFQKGKVVLEGNGFKIHSGYRTIK